MTGRKSNSHEAISLTDEAISCCRALVEGLSPPMLRDADLSETMKRLAMHMRSQHGLDVQLVVEDSARPAPESLRILFYAIARELLFNTVKHAQIHQAAVRLGRENGHIFLEVADEGAGCEPSLLEKTGTENLGLFSIRERLAVLGGSMLAWAAPEQGCRIRVIVPVTVEAPEQEPLPAATAEALPLQAARPGELYGRLM